MLSTVSTIAEILFKLAQAAPAVVATVQDLIPLATNIKQAAGGETMTQAQKDALDAEIDALINRLLEPLPPG